MTIVSTIQSLEKTAVGDAVKAAGVVLVVLGAVPAIAQGLGIVHIVVPAAVLGYATVATTVITGALSWAKSHGLVAKLVGR